MFWNAVYTHYGLCKCEMCNLIFIRELKSIEIGSFVLNTICSRVSSFITFDCSNFFRGSLLPTWSWRYFLRPRHPGMYIAISNWQPTLNFELLRWNSLSAEILMLQHESKLNFDLCWSAEITLALSISVLL